MAKRTKTTQKNKESVIQRYKNTLLHQRPSKLQKWLFIGAQEECGSCFLVWEPNAKYPIETEKILEIITDPKKTEKERCDIFHWITDNSLLVNNSEQIIYKEQCSIPGVTLEEWTTVRSKSYTLEVPKFDAEKHQKYFGNIQMDKFGAWRWSWKKELIELGLVKVFHFWEYY